MNEAAANALYDQERKGLRQIKGTYYREGGACALGAIALGLRRHDLLPLGFPDHLRGTEMECPVCGLRHVNEGSVIVHMNDDHGLTFSEIARKLGPDGA